MNESTPGKLLTEITQELRISYLSDFSLHTYVVSRMPIL